MTEFREAIQGRLIQSLERALRVVLAAVFAILVLHILPQLAGGPSLLKWVLGQ